MSKKTKISNWPRPILQWGFILVISIIALIPKVNETFIPDVEAYCPFGGIQALGSYFLNQALSCTMTSAQIAMGILLLLSVFVFSKLFLFLYLPGWNFERMVWQVGR